MRNLLLHSCCGPCSTSVLERVIEEYNVTIFFYNPNITDLEEYERRLQAQLAVIEWIEKKKKKKIGLISGDYNVEDFYSECKKYDSLPEGGKRCEVCFEIRLRETAYLAKQNNFDAFTTTLTVSPQKNAEIINDIGRKIAIETETNFLEENFKKKAGYQRSIELSKLIGIYRQHYCGCEYSYGRKSRKL